MAKSKAKDPLVEYREKHGLTQQQAADRIGISRSLLSQLEIGKKTYTAELCVQIERKTGILRERIREDLFARKAA